MISTRLRRLLAAALTFALALGAATAAPAVADEQRSSAFGALEAPAGIEDISPVTIRFYRWTGDADDPWELVETTRSAPMDSNGRYPYAAALTAGVYRATINELDDGSAAWPAWKPAGFTDIFNGYNPYFTIDGVHAFNMWISYLELRSTGKIAGTIHSQCGVESRPSGSVEVYPQDQADPVISFRARGGANGAFSVPALAVPAKLRTANNESGGWSGDAATYADATSIAAADGATSTGNDLHYRRALDLNPDRSQGLYAEAVQPDGRGAGGVRVRYYRATGITETPWELVSSGLTSAPRSDTDVSGFQSRTPAGEYRVTFNEIPEDSAASRAWLPTTARDGTDALTCVDAGVFAGARGHMKPAGGAFSGIVTDRHGAPVKGATVEVYDATDPSTLATAKPVSTVKTGADGTYTAHALSGPTTFRVTKAATYTPTWSGSKTVPITAAAFAVALDQTSTGHDVKLVAVPLKSTRKPALEGSYSVGTGKLWTDGGSWSYPVSKKYQWMRKHSNGKSSTIRGATSRTYHPTKSDLGKRVFVRVKGTPTGTYAGLASQTVDSYASGYLRQGMSLKAKYKASGNDVVLTFKVKIAGVKKPKGKAKVRYVPCRWKQNRGYICRGGKTKTVTFKNGKGSTRLNTKSGSYDIWVYIPESKTRTGAGDGGLITIR